ncbi:MAG: pyruvate dehydrogenase E2 component (dihydrolipoamide acetyltransferase) [Gammaproteobacteria bacterium]
MSESKTINLPDVGDFDEIEVIELLVAVGDQVEKEQSIIMLESDKATMEIPSPFSGQVESINVKVGDRIGEGHAIAVLKVDEASSESEPAKEKAPEEKAESPPADKDEKANETPDDAPADEPSPVVATDDSKPAEQEAALGKARKPHPGENQGAVAKSTKMVHASPSIRRYARDLGANLDQVIGTGSKGRILKADVKAFIKSAMSGNASGAATGTGIPKMPEVDHSRFGEIETLALSRIQKISGAHLHRSWVNVPHVTQFDEADITELEAFRKSLSKEAEAKGVRLTPLVFLMKAAVAALVEFPNVNASLDASGENLILKKYFNIGVAVDTPDGLVVPVIRDVDQKGLFELAGELGDTAARARDGKLTPAEMQGGCFTISSLGGIGGTQFTPIVNAPEVAILGVARSKMQPVYQEDGSFVPRLILPLALSYDHRVIDGAQGARFTRYLGQVIADIRRVLL